jgi:hydroxymethylpyrimidine pyrophosphatase-like HAD family hydrolase
MPLIACDFDGTIVEHRYPNIGKPLDGAMETLRDLIAAGNRLILNTCREDCKKRKYLSEAVEFCKENGVVFVSVNENSLDDDFRDENGLRRKVYAHHYIDDANIGGFIGWDKVRQLLGLSPLDPEASTSGLREGTE